jgi:hypothetical protein
MPNADLRRISTARSASVELDPGGAPKSGDRRANSLLFKLGMYRFDRLIEPRLG